MSTKVFDLLLLLLVTQNICDAAVPLLSNQIDTNLLQSVYYDPKTGLGLKGAVETTAKTPLGQIGFRGISCQCEALVCSCCTGIKIPLFKIDQQSCTTLKYVPEDFAIKASLDLNDKEILSSTLSGKNPPPVCVSPPNLPFVTFCIRVFDIYTSGKNLHACLDVETRLSNAPVLVLHFNCLQVGLDGIAWGYPESTNTVSLVQNQLPISHPEVYDDVNFEPEDLESHASTSTLTPEQEAQIGQLKL